MPTTLRSGIRTARKPHRCDTCHVVIAVGERYSSSANVYDGRVYDWRTCLACFEDRITGEVYDWAGCPDEGVGFDSALEWAHECRDDARYGEIARAWLSRSGCTCEVCAPLGGAS